MTKADNIIAIASGKGGVGKTWLSITLAHHLARAGRKVLLFDGDIGLANVDVQLGLTPTNDLAEVFAGRARLKEVITSHKIKGLDIIAGRSGSGSFGTVSPERMHQLNQELVALANEYDIVLLDLGAGVEHHVRALSMIASRCVIVLTDEPTSLTDAYAFIKLSHAQKHAPDIQIVVNQASTLKEGERTYGAILKACESFLKISPPCLGIVRRDPKVKESIRSQTSLVEKWPGTTAAVDAATISTKLMVNEKTA